MYWLVCMKAVKAFLILSIMAILMASFAFADPEINLTIPVNLSTYNTTPIPVTWISVALPSTCWDLATPPTSLLCLGHL